MIMRAWQSASTALVALAVLASTGCVTDRLKPTQPVGNIPKELVKTTLPEHMIEPPDVLQIDLVAAVPKPPYKLQPLDGISLRGTGVLPDSPIGGVYQIDTDGTINIGSAYGGPIMVAGMTTNEAKAAILEVLKKIVVAPSLEIALAQTRGMQQVRGPHLVRPDGTVWFDLYGSVRVVGMTLPQAKAAIEEHLSQYFLKPEVAVSITGFNSKVYYVIFDGSFDGGSQIVRLPVTGNETIIDAISAVGGLPQTADYKRIWIARPSPEGSCPQILPVDWKGISELAQVDTNYQILPGDRIFVKSAPMVVLTAKIDRFVTPFERLLGFILLAQNTAFNFRNRNNPNAFFNGGQGF